MPLIMLFFHLIFEKKKKKTKKSERHICQKWISMLIYGPSTITSMRKKNHVPDGLQSPIVEVQLMSRRKLGYQLQHIREKWVKQGGGGLEYQIWLQSIYLDHTYTLILPPPCPLIYKIVSLMQITLHPHWQPHLPYKPHWLLWNRPLCKPLNSNHPRNHHVPWRSVLQNGFHQIKWSCLDLWPWTH